MGDEMYTYSSNTITTSGYSNGTMLSALTTDNTANWTTATINWTAPQWSFTPDFLKSLGDALEQQKVEESEKDTIEPEVSWDINLKRKHRVRRVSANLNNSADVILSLKKRKRSKISL